MHTNHIFVQHSYSVKRKNQPSPAWHVKIAIVNTTVDFDQLSLYSTGTSLFSNYHI